MKKMIKTSSLQFLKIDSHQPLTSKIRTYISFLRDTICCSIYYQSCLGMVGLHVKFVNNILQQP